MYIIMIRFSSLLYFLGQQTHLEKCPNVRVSCSLGCGASLSKDELSAHTASQCPNRPSQCQHCKKKVPTSLLEVRDCQHGSVLDQSTE